MVLHHPVLPTVVLVVEDEMLLRIRAVDMLEDAAFTPLEPVDADEAVAILESRSDIALLFTDIHVPGSMDGLMLAHALLSFKRSGCSPSRYRRCHAYR